jgi:hypothetical protein
LWFYGKKIQDTVYSPSLNSLHLFFRNSKEQRCGEVAEEGGASKLLLTHMRSNSRRWKNFLVKWAAKGKELLYEKKERTDNQ